MSLWWRSCLIVSFFFLSIQGYQIRNGNVPLCKKCIYFQPSRFVLPHDAIEHGTCQYYGKKDVVSGKIKHEYASNARKYQDCGENGTRYVEDPKYRFKRTFPFFYHMLSCANTTTTIIKP